MKRRFVVAVDRLTSEQEKALVAYLKDGGLAWWHWLPGVWLATTRREDVNAAQLRDALRDIARPKRLLVLEVGEHKDWSGIRNDKKMFDWIRSTWAED